MQHCKPHSVQFLYRQSKMCAALAQAGVVLCLQMANLKSDQEQATALLASNKQKALQVAAHLHMPCKVPVPLGLNNHHLIAYVQAHASDPGHVPSCIAATCICHLCASHQEQLHFSPSRLLLASKYAIMD